MRKKETGAFLTRGVGQTYPPTWGSNPCQLFYQGTNRAESSQKIGQKIWKINQITSKCHVGTNGSGDKNLPNNEVGQIDGGQIWGETWQKRGEIGQKLRRFGKYGMRFGKYGRRFGKYGRRFGKMGRDLANMGGDLANMEGDLAKWEEIWQIWEEMVGK